MEQKLPTDPYKGVRDFYPADMAIQQYIFGVWSRTAESFGFERYDASILEPSILYKAKGAQNEEMVNDQTYTSAARMIAGRWRELAPHAPIRWYSMPSLYRYERTQRGRFREHWQLNCDVFGVNDVSIDIEIIALAYHIFKNFGAADDMFRIHINNRATMDTAYRALGITDSDTIMAITRVNDRKDKITNEEYLSTLTLTVGDQSLALEIKRMVETTDGGDNQVVAGLAQLGITNVILDRSLARGFDYYTGTIFEIKDTSDEGLKTLTGGGRYDNLTALFGSDNVSGIGFGMGDARMQDFLTVHNLLPTDLSTQAEVVVMSFDPSFNMEAQKVASMIRTFGKRVATDVSAKRLGDKIGRAAERNVASIVVVGETETASNSYTRKDLATNTETHGTLQELFA
jgi:histidyl-tRNA synthetase